MKKIAILFLPVLLMSTMAFAQQGFHFGAIGNFNTVWIVNQNAYGYDEFDYKLDLKGAGGVEVGYNLSDHIGFLGQLKVAGLGQKYEDSHHTGITREIKFSYVQVPVLFQFIGGSEGVRFYANAGPEFCFLNKASLIGFKTKDTSITATTLDGKPRFNSSDIRVNFGLGANISFTDNLYLSVGMSFDYSFGDINAKNASGPDAYRGDPENPTWHWPDEHSTGIYKQSRNATGGIQLGIHYIITQ